MMFIFQHNEPKMHGVSGDTLPIDPFMYPFAVSNDLPESKEYLGKLDPELIAIIDDIFAKTDNVINRDKQEEGISKAVTRDLKSDPEPLNPQTIKEDAIERVKQKGIVEEARKQNINPDEHRPLTNRELDIALEKFKNAESVTEDLTSEMWEVFHRSKELHQLKRAELVFLIAGMQEKLNLKTKAANTYYMAYLIYEMAKNYLKAEEAIDRSLVLDPHNKMLNNAKLNIFIRKESY